MSTLVLTAHQPSYLPWGGLLAKIAKADLFCSFDAVQMTSKDWVTRNYIKTDQGPLMLTVPVRSKNHMSRPICEVEIAAGVWTRKHMRSIELAYRKAAHFDQHFAGIGAVLDLYSEGGLLVELNLDILRYFMRALGIQKPIVNASDHDFQGEKSALVLDMCIKLRASEYIFGGEGESYADKASFHEAGIQPSFHVYQQKVYPQLHGDFVPNLSCLDLLMNCGPESSGYL